MFSARKKRKEPKLEGDSFFFDFFLYYYLIFGLEAEKSNLCLLFAYNLLSTNYSWKCSSSRNLFLEKSVWFIKKGKSWKNPKEFFFLIFSSTKSFISSQVKLFLLLLDIWILCSCSLLTLLVWYLFIKKLQNNDLFAYELAKRDELSLFIYE